MDWGVVYFGLARTWFMMSHADTVMQVNSQHRQKLTANSSTFGMQRQSSSVTCPGLLTNGVIPPPLLLQPSEYML